MSAPDESTLNMISKLLDALRGHERRFAAAEQRIRELQTCHNTTVNAIQALEATQHAHADASRMSDAEREQFYAELAKPARIEALKTAASAPPDHLRDAPEMVATDAELIKSWDVRNGDHLARIRFIYNLGRQHGATQATCPHIATSDEGTSYCRLAEQGNRQGILDSSPAPAGGLVERVADAMYGGTEAVILAVADWLVEQSPEPGPVGKLLGQISTPFAVMADMLREEVKRNG